MKNKRLKRHWRSGMTLIEIMVAILVLLIAALGTSGVRYHTELNVRKAEAQIAAARVRSLLCESWRGSNVNIATNPDGPAVESGYSALGNVKVIVDDQNFYDVYWPWLWSAG